VKLTQHCTEVRDSYGLERKKQMNVYKRDRERERERERDMIVKVTTI